MPDERRGQKKGSRIDVRVSSEHKELLETAAAMKGLSLSAYMLSESLAAAQKDIKAHQKLTLSDRDRDLFLSAMYNPPSPNSALSAAIAEFQSEYEDKPL